MDGARYSEQLPRADRNSELETLSMNALNSALPVDLFVFRDERINDVGVDGSLELKIDSRYANLRSQVQLKSTDSEATNKDGSVSVQVPVANLNYLLAGARSPLYVLFIAPRNELRFAWAADERMRISKINPGWATQKEISIRFSEILDVEAVGQIHERIQRESRLQRKITDTLSRASNTESVIIAINPETLKITDPIEAQQALLTSGSLIVSAGYPEQVRNLVRLLDVKTAQLPRILLVRAYAEYMLGRFKSADALLSEAKLSRTTLSDDDQQFLDFLSDGCDYRAGKISIHELAARIDRKEQSHTGGFAISYRAEQLRYKVILNPDPVSQTETLDELRLFVEKVTKANDLSDAIKLFCRCSLLEADGFHRTRSELIELGEARIKIGLGQAPDVPAMQQHHLSGFSDWEDRIIVLIADAAKVGHPILNATANLIRATVTFHHLLNQKSIHRLFDINKDIPSKMIDGFLHYLERVLAIYSQADHLEGELRSEMLMADFLELAGRISDAQGVAESVLPRAKAMGYTQIVDRAEEHIAGQGILNTLESISAQKSEEQMAVSLAAKSDEQLRTDAAQLFRLSELPAERLPVVERACASRRDCAREQVAWCKHIELLEDKRHEMQRATMYRVDPPRACVCKLHGYRSIFIDPDWRTLFTAFKRTYCEGCPDRNPFKS